jgi:hypothetical protein
MTAPQMSFNLVANSADSKTTSIDANILNGILQPHPLYDRLLEQVQSRPLKTIDITRVCTTINNIAQTLPPNEAAAHYKEIGGLILHHQLLANNGVMVSLIPFDGKVMAGGKGVLHYIMNLPPTLQQIIAQYVENPDVSQ